MKKVIAAVVAVLVIGSSAIGQINLQFEYWDLGLNNTINLSGGPGTAGTTQGIGTLSVQDLGINPDMNGDPTATAGQGIGAALFQTGSTETGGGLIVLDQDLNVKGIGITVNGTPLPAGQTQSIGDLAGPTLQYQGASVDGDQKLEKGVGSAANANGLNLAAFGMGQSAGNNCADGCQLSLILGGQFSEIDGAAQSKGTVVTGMTAIVQQFQSANNPPVPVQP